MKYYMEDEHGDEGIYPLDYFKSMIDEEVEEIKLFEMKRDYGNEMWCEENQEFVEKRNECGYFCNNYKPCNGKSGRCRNLKNGFVETGREFILTKSGLKEVK